MPVFDADQVPRELILEVVGFGHKPNADVSSVCLGDEVQDEVQLVVEDVNPHDDPHDPHDTNDTNAVAIFDIDTCNLGRVYRRIGYVNRAIVSIVRTRMKDRKVSAKIERVNDKLHRPPLCAYGCLFAKQDTVALTTARPE